MLYLLIGGLMLMFLALGGSAAWAHWQGQKLRLLAQSITELQAQQANIDALNQELETLRDVQREQAAMVMVYAQVLLEKGLIEEHELEDAHLRMIVEPALRDREQEDLLADLPNPDQIREHLVRNLPPIIQ